MDMISRLLDLPLPDLGPTGCFKERIGMISQTVISMLFSLPSSWLGVSCSWSHPLDVVEPLKEILSCF